MDQKTKCIWKNGENNENTWMCFVKKFTVTDSFAKAITHIAVDSKYWLYINGKLAIFEGGIKRGPDKHSTYYDEIDIARFLKTGENTIAILVCYYGKHGFSHLDSGRGGLLFESHIGGNVISSDESWKVKKHPAYVEADEKDEKSNFRLSESNLYFDASKDITDWYKEDYDVSKWDNADVIEDVLEYWGSLHKRITPQIKDLGYKNYLNSDIYKGYVTSRKETIKVQLPYNAQITPILKVTAPKGKRISIKADNYVDSLYDTKSVMSVYYTKDGYQEYESLGWMNGEYIYYEFDEGITINELGYHETGYDTEFVGSFTSDDPFLDKLWDKSLRTLYITMRDNFMDCPDRERAQWWGDVNIEMQEMLYALDEKALLLYKKGVDMMARWTKESGYMLTVVPSGKDQFELPMQNLAGILGFWYYYTYTGDASLLPQAYEASSHYLKLFDMEDGLVAHRKGSWDWPDWGDNADIAPMENAWYYMALESCINMASYLDKKDEIDFFLQRKEMIKNSFDKAFWKGSYYYKKTDNNCPDDRANALAVISGLASSDKYKDITKILEHTMNSSPYMEKYVLDALCEMGQIDKAIVRIKDRYKEMVNFNYSTLWEYWNQDGTLNHAWSGGPLITMSKYIAGIRPIETGYKKFEVRPYLADLSHVKCTVPSAKGPINVAIKRDEDRYHMELTIPEGSLAYIYLPFSNPETLNKICYKYDVTEDNCAFLQLESGHYII
ncbi:MAG: glycoside hydrolase [Butyrivibrio sp.]|jgi:hypothetical protein|nr:glycoside hydrolase [Butyrivibrio sp.]